jgi:hypothetical protein
VDDIAQSRETDTDTTIAQGMRRDIATGAAQVSAAVIAIEIAQENVILDEIGTAMSHGDIESDPNQEAGESKEEEIETCVMP